MEGRDWAEVIMAGNQVFLQDYATVTGKPIATTRPNSIMGAITGTDLGNSGASQGLSSAAIVALIVLVIGGVIILRS